MPSSIPGSSRRRSPLPRASSAHSRGSAPRPRSPSWSATIPITTWSQRMRLAQSRSVSAVAASPTWPRPLTASPIWRLPRSARSKRRSTTLRRPRPLRSPRRPPILKELLLMPKPMSMTIAGRRIGPGEPPYVIAELSANHNGDIERAFAILDMAKAAGADAIKLQTYRPDTITIDHDGPGFRIDEGPWAGRTLYELYEEAHMPWPWHAPLFARARKLGLAIFSSVFDETSI